MRKLQKSRRRLLVQFISGHRHIECVEVLAEVWNPRPDRFLADMKAVEREARMLLESREAMVGSFGPWRDRAEDFQFIGALCAILRSLEAGRIGWVDRARLETAPAPGIDPPP